MAVKVLIPTVLQKHTGDRAVVECEGTNVIEVLDNLETSYPAIKGRLRDDAGALRRFVNFYANEEDIRFLDNDKTALADGDELSIVPAVAGG